MKLTIYHPKFNTNNLVIYYNFSPSTSYVNTTNVVYEFKCLLEDCFSCKYLHLPITTNLSRLYQSDMFYLSKLNRVSPTNAKIF